jgi:hypothetical protein
MDKAFTFQDIKHKKYYSSSIRNKLKTIIRPLILEKKINTFGENIKKFNLNVSRDSKYREIPNHATINFKSIGKNTFINVLYKDRIIYNKSIGKLKINNVKIKKKEKSIKKNLFLFSKEFTDHFFNNIKEKFKIENLSINFICKSSNYYTFKKFFFYRIIGLIYKKSRKTRRYNFKRNKFREILIKEFPYVGRGLKGRGYSPYESKKPKWYHQNNTAKINKYLHNFKTINLISIKIINKFSYNGCKKKKIKKI